MADITGNDELERVRARLKAKQAALERAATKRDARFVGTVYMPPGAANIPMRDWVIHPIALRNNASVVAGSGGAGKSSLAITMSLHAALGMNLGRFTVAGRTRVAFLLAEEDRGEVDRRIEAAIAHFGIDPQQLAGYLIQITTDGDMLLARSDDSGAMQPTPAFDSLVALIREHRADLVVLDPFIRLWAGNENDNPQVGAVAAMLQELARDTGCAVLLVHHVRKGKVEPGDADAARGGSALSTTVRGSFTLTPMTAEMAEMYDLGDGGELGKLRLDPAKGNYIPKDASTDWFAFVDVQLANGPKITPSDGDHVGVLAPWKPPALFAGASPEGLKQALAAIGAGILDDQGSSTGELYTDSRQSPKRWAGNVLMDMFGWSDEKAGRVVRDWLKRKVLVKCNYVGKRRAPVTGLKLAEEKPVPGAENGV